MRIKNGMDVIDLMGPEAQREDYEHIRDCIQEMLDDPHMWNTDVDECILEYPCSVCGAKVGEHCTVAGVKAPQAKNSDAFARSEGPQFYRYHAKRTDAGCLAWNEAQVR